MDILELSRAFEIALKVNGWDSGFLYTDRFLKHYSRKTKSEHTRLNVLGILDTFLKFAKVENPDFAR